MFLRNLIESNPEFVDVALTYQQNGSIPANSYVIDLDAVRDNALQIKIAANSAGISTIYPMTKQIGRNPKFMDVLADLDIRNFVAVDMACARAIKNAGYGIGNLGHLVQVARHEIAEGMAMEPEYWTVFSRTQAQRVSDAAVAAGRTQKLLMRIFGPGDDIVDTHSGGFSITDFLDDVSFLQGLPNVQVAGVTTYPSATFESRTREVVATHNVTTMNEAASTLSSLGVIDPQINWPSEVSFASIPICASGNATQIEPGHAFTGTSPLQVFDSNSEKQAILYLSEVSHLDRDDALYYEAVSGHFYGGGLYECIGAVEHTHEAIVGKSGSDYTVVELTIPPDGVIDFYGRLNFAPSVPVQSGDSVIVCSRPQVFFTRAYVVPVSGIASGSPHIEGIYDAQGFPSAAPPAHFG